MTLVRLPSVLVDQVAEDFLDAVAGTVVGDNVEPFSITDGQTVDVEVDGGAVQQIAMVDGDFVDMARATAAEVIAVLNAWLTGATASVDAGRIRITTDQHGAAGSIRVTGEPMVIGGPADSFDFPTGLAAGLDASVQLIAVNQIPEPGELEVPLNSTIEFDLYHAGGSAPASSGIVVEVDGEVVLTGGVAQAGWAVAFANPDSATRHVELTPPGNYASDSIVAVHVEALSTELDWSFRTFDVTRPSTLSAAGRDKRRIRVTFSEPMRQVDPAGAADALNPANYLIERVSTPAVNVQVIEVQPVSGSQVDLIADIELTFGAAYQLTVGQILDVAGNLHVDPPDNTVPFTAYLPVFPAGRRFVLTDHIAQINIAEDQTRDLRLFLGCTQEVLNLLLCQIDEWGDILDPDLASEDVIDVMLADLGNPFTSFDLSDVDKRRLLRVLVHIYQLKGTDVGIVDAVLFFTGIPMQVRTFRGWRLGPASEHGGAQRIGSRYQQLSSGAPATIGPDQRGRFSFKLVSPVDLTAEQRATVAQLATYMKSAREHYIGTIEPTPPPGPNHLALGHSRLGGTGVDAWRLHEG